ncbi:unnamed protein product [Prorocentrum cordatum]|uniref:Uncharacterized protein n=1 Tax=Prorocentrum cordatum TaxID=2364126 RepID=A0ABN9S5H8_9DINO|nr:unnamed protein product [Polarella glacialis]
MNRKMKGWQTLSMDSSESTRSCHACRLIPYLGAIQARIKKPATTPQAMLMTERLSTPDVASSRRADSTSASRRRPRNGTSRRATSAVMSPVLWLMSITG